MNSNPDLSILSDNVDKSQVPPIEQKRMVAFINEFIISTVSFLNEFMTKCETKFVEFEQKMQRIEASLLIVEAKMASIPDVDLKPTPSSSTKPSTSSASDQTETPKTEIPNETEPKIATEIQSAGVQETPATPSTSQPQPQSQTNENDSQTPASGQDEHDNEVVKGVKACEDIVYRKYFKMLQFGVPAPAIKLKIANDGYNPNVLDDPNRILEDGTLFVAPEE